MKYIMFEDAEGRKVPVIFPENYVHVEVARAMQSRRISPVPVMPIRAGFVNLGTDVTVYGESETLGIKSKDIDAAFIMGGDAISMMPDIFALNLIGKLKERK
jgi:hypothetical protein